MHCERRLLTTLIARDVTDPGPVPICALDSGLLMGGTIPLACAAAPRGTKPFFVRRIVDAP